MKRSFDDLVSLMRSLRSPEGCPWDREQTYESLRQFVIEEAYEVVDAIDRADRAGLEEEIGDMLLQAVFLAQLSAEEGGFTIADSITAIHDKLVRRHPHVFGDVKADSPEQVLTNWERLKKEEKKEKQEEFFSGIPRSLPALQKAVRITEKAARVGFDWRKTEDVFEKLDEESEELRDALARGDEQEIAHELGDILFTIANIARRLNVDAENALQQSNRKFIRRFEAVEKRLAQRNESFDDVALEEMDALWDEVKREE
ncbi:MAG TPA: nucleoside triphosphate pyrophosphohydrolase [Thermoanaerobaculia bacterium]|nr:nucleoside triphosphate pyrophosphohydrolase [Thermoanaerobaculia bacterium]